MANFDNIKLEKGLYASGNFTKALESIDPTENYKGTSLEGLDAYQRQLKRFGIKVGGPASDVVDKFFKTSDSAVLFPEYISRAVRQGLEQADILSDIVASTTVIDGMDYRSITSIPTEDEKELKVVKEGAFIPETTVHTKENLVKLKKRGRSLVASYEAIRFQRLDLFTVTLRQIGAYIARTLLKDAIGVIVNGDGNDNAAEVVDCAQAGTLAYSDLVSFWNGFDPYELNTFIADPAASSSVDFPSFITKDLLCGSHINDTSIHLSEEQQTFLNTPFVTGTYFGTGDSSRSISLGFAPSVVIVLARGLPLMHINHSESINYALAAVGCQNGGSLGIELTSSSFKVSNSSSTAVRSCYPRLNELGTTYFYIAFR